MPAHRIYVEPFAGAGSVLLRKPRSYSEILNDLDDEVVNLYRVMREPADAAALKALVEFTPYSRTEFNLCFKRARDPIERARRTLVRYWFGFGAGAARTPGSTGFRNNAKRQGSTPAHDWRGFPDHLPLVHDRLRGVTIDNEPAAVCIGRHDGPDVLMYCDPPYLHATRSSIDGLGGKKAIYRHEMTDADHRALLEQLAGCKAMVMLSGYPHQIYDDALPGWTLIEADARGDGAVERTECLWLNPAAVAGMSQQSIGLGVA